MASKLYHISSDGIARPCTAQRGSCPLSAAGAEHGAFESPDAAREWAESTLARKHEGSFGTLAKKIAEQDLEAMEQAQTDALLALDEAKRRKREEAAEHAHRLFAMDHLEAMGKMGPLKKRKAAKEFERVAEALGLGATSDLKKVYLAYVSNYVFDAKDDIGRIQLRDRMVTGKLLRSTGTWSSSSSTTLTLTLDNLEKKLDAVPNEEKPELNLSPYAVGPASDMQSLSNEELAAQLADAEERESYFKDWHDKAKIRLVNYGATSGRSKKRESIFGEEYKRIVIQGPGHGFTEDEAKYFENQQPARWARYHAALKEEAETRLTSS